MIENAIRDAQLRTLNSYANVNFLNVAVRNGHDVNTAVDGTPTNY